MLIWSAETGFGYLHLRGNSEGDRGRHGGSFYVVSAATLWGIWRGACVRAGCALEGSIPPTSTSTLCRGARPRTLFYLGILRLRVRDCPRLRRGARWHCSRAGMRVLAGVVRRQSGVRGWRHGGWLMRHGVRTDG